MCIRDRSGTAFRFADGTASIDLTVGLDGLLYLLSPGGSPGGRTVDVYAPNTYGFVRNIHLTGTTNDGMAIIGTDSIVTTGCHQPGSRKAIRSHMTTTGATTQNPSGFTPAPQSAV